jgi:hypothetical protein
MTETSTPVPTTQPDESTDYKKLGVLGLRFIQLIAIATFVVGFIWGGSDFLSSLLPKDGPVTPLSVLLMLYGIMGTVVIEVAIRIVQRKK